MNGGKAVFQAYTKRFGKLDNRGFANSIVILLLMLVFISAAFAARNLAAIFTLKYRQKVKEDIARLKTEVHFVMGEVTACTDSLSSAGNVGALFVPGHDVVVKKPNNDVFIKTGDNYGSLEITEIKLTDPAGVPGAPGSSTAVLNIKVGADEGSLTSGNYLIRIPLYINAATSGGVESCAATAWLWDGDEYDEASINVTEEDDLCRKFAGTRYDPRNRRCAN